MRVFDFLCADCGESFEAFVRPGADNQSCPRCSSSSVARKPVLHMAIRTSNTRRGRLIDLSSNSCPCGCGGRKHAGR